MQSSHGEVYKVSVSGVPPEPDQNIVLLYPAYMKLVMFKPKTGYLNRPRRRSRPRTRNRKLFKSIEDEHEYEATDELT